MNTTSPEVQDFIRQRIRRDLDDGVGGARES